MIRDDNGVARRNAKSSGDREHPEGDRGVHFVEKIHGGKISCEFQKQNILSLQFNSIKEF